MRIVALLFVVLLGVLPLPGLAMSPTEAAVKRARKVKLEPRFPFGFTPVTQRSALADEFESCLAADAAGGQTCWLKPGASRAIDAGAFHPRQISVRFTPAAGDGRLDLYGVTASMEKIATCQEMSEALQSAIKMVVASYGKPQRMQEGPHFGSSKCSHYRREGQVFYRAFYKGWQLNADVYWSDGYTVYLNWIHEGAAAAHLRAAERAAHRLTNEGQAAEPIVAPR